jgi:hypothetical protein
MIKMVNDSSNDKRDNMCPTKPVLILEVKKQFI